MLNEEVQAWVDLGFSEEEAIAMSNAMKDRYDDVEITDDDSNSHKNDYWEPIRWNCSLNKGVILLKCFLCGCHCPVFNLAYGLDW